MPDQAETPPQSRPSRKLRIIDLVRPHWKALTIADAFRAGGYTHEEIEIYTQAMRKRIAELGAL